ncbi:hypothetical protein BDN70DRAFT_939904 [Pholiota conissans]|uniref:Uncharacterized protein n=1 Tax=Pholiota conissans TaxID=109636 RepID=A0A9P6CS44_9AGAR|nr:hypothetical protein BDN70DRAFT_939904 [Pholiota conissans]
MFLTRVRLTDVTRALGRANALPNNPSRARSLSASRSHPKRNLTLSNDNPKYTYAIERLRLATTVTPSPSFVSYSLPSIPILHTRSLSTLKPRFTTVPLDPPMPNDTASFVPFEFTIGLQKNLKKLKESPEEMVATAKKVVRKAGMPTSGTLYVINDMHRSMSQRKKKKVLYGREHFTAVVFDNQGIFYGITHFAPDDDDCEIRQYNPERSAKKQTVIEKWRYLTLAQLKQDGSYVEITTISMSL